MRRHEVPFNSKDPNEKQSIGYIGIDKYLYFFNAKALERGQMSYLQNLLDMYRAAERMDTVKFKFHKQNLLPEVSKALPCMVYKPVQESRFSQLMLTVLTWC